MKKQLNKRIGFTLVELLVATGLLSLVIVSAFSLSNSSNKSFETGTWRINRQKAAQIFLLRFKETLERVNHANAVGSGGETTRVGGSRDIVIAAPWYNKVASTTDSGILFASTTKPFIQGSAEFGTEEVRGAWKGIGLECFNKKLSLYQTGDWNNMLTSTPVVAGSADIGRFVIGDVSGDFVTQIDDVDSVGLFVKLASDSVTLKRPEIFLTLQIKMVNPKSKGQVSITEEMTVKVLDRLETEVVKGAASYPTIGYRKK